MNKNERGRFWEGKDYIWLWRKERKFVFILTGKSAGVTFLEVRSNGVPFAVYLKYLI